VLTAGGLWICGVGQRVTLGHYDTEDKLMISHSSRKWRRSASMGMRRLLSLHVDVTLQRIPYLFHHSTVTVFTITVQISKL